MNDRAQRKLLRELEDARLELKLRRVGLTVSALAFFLFFASVPLFGVWGYLGKYSHADRGDLVAMFVVIGLLGSGITGFCTMIIGEGYGKSWRRRRNASRAYEDYLLDGDEESEVDRRWRRQMSGGGR